MNSFGGTTNDFFFNKINRNKAKKLNELLLKNKKIDNEIYSLFSETGDENSEEIIIKIVGNGN